MGLHKHKTDIILIIVFIILRQLYKIKMLINNINFQNIQINTASNYNEPSIMYYTLYLLSVLRKKLNNLKTIHLNFEIHNN